MEKTQTRRGGGSDPVPAPLWARFPGLPACPPACPPVYLSLWSSGSSILPTIIRITCLLITFTSPTSAPTYLSTPPRPRPSPSACHRYLAPPRPPHSDSPLNFSSQATCCLPEPKTVCHQRRRERGSGGEKMGRSP